MVKEVDPISVPKAGILGTFLMTVVIWSMEES